MAPNALDRQLTELEACRYRFGRYEAARVVKLLNRLDAARIADTASLIRFHEALLFLRAFPQGRAVVRVTERILNSFHKKVEALRKAGADMNDFEPIEVSGIAGTEMEDTLSFDLASWLIKRMPGKVEIAWENYEPGRELGNTGPRFMPLLEDDAYVEADTPWRRWLETASEQTAAPEQHTGLAAKRRKSAAHGVSRGYESELWQPQRGERKIPGRVNEVTATWLIERFERLPLPDPKKAELYESLHVPLRWDLGNSRITRTRNWKPVRKVFYHDGPLISRSQVSLPEELARRPPALTRLSLQEG